ncbi:MAG TPA: class I SAM-dependent methyltransferase [Bryobacteraceae bacterium]|nr:class I SAM-dependent methyltransferase [Bryobacteraceae bacterium]
MSETYFNQVAGLWDQMRASFFSEAVREKACEAAQIVPGRLAADLGAGTGFITEALLDRGLRVIAVDQSPTMLQVLRSKFPGHPALDCRLGRDTALPIGTGEVDYAFANMYLHHVESPPAAIREMARILKPGGTLVITDLDEHDFEFLRTEQHDRWLGFRRQDVRAWLEDAGLIHARVDCAGARCCAPSEASGAHASVSIFVASGRKPVSGA